MKTSPGEIFPPICRKSYGHTDAEHSSGLGLGIAVKPGPITWPNLGDSVFPEGEEEQE